jgi:hypothetical protein
LDFRRPGLKSSLSEEERRYGEQWLGRFLHLPLD